MDLLHSYAACCNPLRHPHFPTLNRLVVGSIPTASTTSQFSSQLRHHPAGWQRQDDRRFGIVFNHKDGDNKEAPEKIANDIQPEMKGELPTAKTLFEPA